MYLAFFVIEIAFEFRKIVFGYAGGEVRKAFQPGIIGIYSIQLMIRLIIFRILPHCHKA